MKKAILIIGVIVVIVGVIIGIAFYLTSDLPKAADQFFTLIKDGKTREAYDSTAKLFQSTTSYEAFEKFSKELSLSSYQSAFWTNRSIHSSNAGSTGKLEGSLKTSAGGTIPLEVNLIKENSVWKITSLDSKRGLTEKQSIPDDTELIKFTDDSMNLFAAALSKKDFSDFYGSLSELWKSQTDPSQLKNSFRNFIEQEIDLLLIKTVKPTFSEKPSINKDGVLLLTGYYPAKDMTVQFELKYLYEHPKWKLVGIKVDLK